LEIGDPGPCPENKFGQGKVANKMQFTFAATASGVAVAVVVAAAAAVAVAAAAAVVVHNQRRVSCQPEMVKDTRMLQ